MMDIKDFDALNDFQKNRLIALAESMEDQINYNNTILESFRSGAGKHFSVTFHLNDLAVVECTGKASYPDAPYTFAILANGKWSSANTYYSSPEQAFLGALGQKNLGPNSQFVNFAVKMLQP